MPKTIPEITKLFHKTTPGERDNDTIISLCKSLISNFVLFESLDNHHVEGIAQFATLDFVLKDAVVIRQDDIGQTFHILLSGRCCCYKSC